MTTNAPGLQQSLDDETLNIADITAEWYKTSTLADIIASVETLPFPPNHLPDAVADGSVSKVVFARICERNPRIAVRYADWRLVKPSDDGKGLDYFFIPKSWAVELHINHLDENGEWIRDVYEVDKMGNAKFSSYVTQVNEGRYYADLDLALAHGHMDEPKFSNYLGYVPPSVHDPIANVGKVRKTVGRIVDAALL